MTDPITIRPAEKTDAAGISAILACNRSDPGLFQESPGAIASSIVDFFVACTDCGDPVGCAGLHQDSPELAEIYAVAVMPQFQSRGTGRRLVETCEERARSVGIDYLWLATIKPEYFCRFGFQVISRWQLPSSVLLRKLRQVLHQPFGRWLPALTGRHTFMCKTRISLPEKS